MAHYARELSDEAWYRGLKVPQTVLRNIDEKTKKAVSESGGTWAPSSAIVIGGAGLELQCRLTLSSSAQCFPGAAYDYQFGDDDYFKIDGTYSRDILDSPLLVQGLRSSGFPREVIPIFAGATLPCIRFRRNGAFFRMPIRLPDGARLSNIEVSFRVTTSHANVPKYLLRARAVRIATDGTVTAYPNQTNATVQPGGWVQPTRPATGALWFNSGSVQTFNLTFTSTTAQERASTALYGYAVEFLEESGTNAWNDSTTETGTEIRMVKTSFVYPDLRPY